MIDFLIKLILPAIIIAATFFGFGVKKFIERSSEMMAEDWYQKRKG